MDSGQWRDVVSCPGDISSGYVVTPQCEPQHPGNFSSNIGGAPDARAPSQSILISRADQITELTLHSRQRSTARQSFNNISTCYNLPFNTPTCLMFRLPVFDVSSRLNHKQNILVWIIIWVQFSLEMAWLVVQPVSVCLSVWHNSTNIAAQWSSIETLSNNVNNCSANGSVGGNIFCLDNFSLNQSNIYSLKFI